MLIPALPAYLLPTEISSIIFDHLDAKTYHPTLLVCKSWSQTLLNYIGSYYSQYRNFVPQSYLQLVESDSNQSMAKCVFITAKKITAQYNLTLKKEIAISLEGLHLRGLIKEIQREQLIDALGNNKNNHVELQAVKNLSEKNLIDFFKTLSKLYLKDNVKRILNSQDLLLFSNIEQLFLDVNTEIEGQLDCTTLNKFSFLKLINIKEIEISNDEEKLTKSLKQFINTDQITCLILKAFSLTAIPPTVFSQFEKLQELEFNNEFTTFPYEAFNLKNLNYLTLKISTPQPDPEIVYKNYNKKFIIKSSEDFFTVWINPSSKRKHPED